MYVFILFVYLFIYKPSSSLTVQWRAAVCGQLRLVNSDVHTITKYLMRNIFNINENWGTDVNCCSLHSGKTVRLESCSVPAVRLFTVF